MTVPACPVHHLPLKGERLRITYGLADGPRTSPGRSEWQEVYFPYANSVIYGGCVIGPDSPQYEGVLYCPKCRKVEEVWDLYGDN